MICVTSPKDQITFHMFIQPWHVLESVRTHNLEYSRLVDCTWQLHIGPSCVLIYKWAQSDQNDKGANLIAVSEADLFSVYSQKKWFLRFSGWQLSISIARQRCDVLRSRAIGHEVNFCSLFSWSWRPLKFHRTCKHWTLILLYQLRLSCSQKGYPIRACY